MRGLAQPRRSCRSCRHPTCQLAIDTPVRGLRESNCYVPSIDTFTLEDELGGVLSFVEGTRDGRPLADLADVAPERSLDHAARAVMAHCPGWFLSTRDKRLAANLRSAGARQTRHVHVMARSTQPGGPGNAPDALASVTLHLFADFEWADILPSWKAAYAPGHPDFEPGDDEDLIETELRPYVEREALGPVHRSTTLATIDGRVTGAIVISLRPEPVPFGGPWITEVWRDPASPTPGLGAALIGRALAMLCADGFETLGLAVTDGNPARRVYEGLGFEPALESWTYLLPD